MKAINITKFANSTKHFYCSFWNVSPYVDVKNIISGYLTLEDEVFENLEKENNAFIPIKALTEKELIYKAKRILKDYCGFTAKLILVFYEGKYSENRTKYIQNI